MDALEDNDGSSHVDEASAPAPAPLRTTRSAQRRRAAKVPRPESVDRSDVVAETAVAADAVAEPVVAEPPAVEPEPVEADTPPSPETSSTPAAAEPAELNAEDHVMDYAATDTAPEKMADTAEQFAGAGKAMAADLTGRAQDAMAKGGRMIEELNAFSKGNVEALVESSKIAAKGMEALGHEAADFTRKSFEGATAAMRTLAATRSPAEFMKLQGDYVRSMFDAMIAETSKSTELMLKLANDVAQPISNRVALAAEKVKAAA